jgi:ubiquinol-cytochrome c reductase cytochrome b subunit
MWRALADWLDSRTSYRRLIRYLLDEPLPPGTGWAFTTGSVLLLLVGTQIATGVGLTLFYVPTPALAYDSVRYISDELPLGRVMRGLHFWGASFIVVAAAVHLLRVFLFGSYKAPREVTWGTGVVLLLLVLGFSLSGYLLPWDQKAYWATTVTINIARSTPFVGQQIANILRGGPELGALTLGRWYSAHVFVLPAAVVVFIVAHLALMRKHGISGPLIPKGGSPMPFFPWHAVKDTVAMAAVFALLLTCAVALPAHLDEIANPADTSYTPRPEWYFLSLFQLLKYFPGPFEPVATLVVPGLVIGFLLLLPFLERGEDRHPFRRARRPLTLCMGVLVVGVLTLTALGVRDTPPRPNIDDWGPRAIAGSVLIAQSTAACARCHVPGGPAAELSITRISKDEEWLLAHMADPVAIAPGARPPDDPPPAPLMTRSQARAVVAYLRRVRAGSTPPPLTDADRLTAMIFSNTCVDCHRIAGEGGQTGPDLSQVGRRRDEASIRRMIVDPTMEFPDTVMPVFGEQLSPQEIDALARYLATRR